MTAEVTLTIEKIVRVCTATFTHDILQSRYYAIYIVIQSHYVMLLEEAHLLPFRVSVTLTMFPIIALCCLTTLSVSASAQGRTARGLIYSATADYRHDSIPTARDALIAKGQSVNVQFDATEDRTRFTDAGLVSYDLLVFLMNTGEGAAGSRVDSLC